MGEKTSQSESYRERGLAAQLKAAEAPTNGLRILWLELADRYFALAEEYDVGTFLRFAAQVRQSPEDDGD